MKITKNLGMLLLAIYLIVAGVAGLGVIQIAGFGTILAILAIVAGILILLGK